MLRLVSIIELFLVESESSSPAVYKPLRLIIESFTDRHPIGDDETVPVTRMLLFGGVVGVVGVSMLRLVGPVVSDDDDEC